MEFDSKKLRLVLLGLLAISVIIFGGIIFLGMSALSSESQRMVDLKVKSQTADNQLSNLEQSKKDIEKYSYFKDVAKSVIPNDKDQAVAILEINQMAEAAGLSIQNITFPASTLGLGAATTTTTPSATPTQQSAAVPAATTKAISQAKPVAGIPGLYSLELTITPESGDNLPASKQVTYAKMLDFLNRIENNRHTAQITQVSIQPANNNKSLTFTLTINIFIKP